MIEVTKEQGLLNKLGIELSESDKKSIPRKIIVYGGNIFTKLMDHSSSVSNAYGALGFSVIDILMKDSKFKDKAVNRLIKTAGALTYLGMCVYDLNSAFEGDYSHMENLIFDASMATQLGMERHELYKRFTDGKKGSYLKDSWEDLVSLFTSNRTKDDSELSFVERIATSLGYGFGAGTERVKSSFDKYSLEIKLPKIKSPLPAMTKAYGKGIGFGKGAFEKLGKNIKSRKLKRDLDKILNKTYPKFKGTFKEKKEVLENLGQNPCFMEKYEINNAYENFKEKPIGEQIQIMEKRQNDLEKDLVQMKASSFYKRMYYSGEISKTKSDLKGTDKILGELKLEELNLPLKQRKS